jgi:hypothetical protein
MRAEFSHSIRGDAAPLGATAVTGVNIRMIAPMLRSFDPITSSAIRTGVGAAVLGSLAVTGERRVAIAPRDVPLILATGT